MKHTAPLLVRLLVVCLCIVAVGTEKAPLGTVPRRLHSVGCTEKPYCRHKIPKHISSKGCVGHTEWREVDCRCTCGTAHVTHPHHLQIRHPGHFVQSCQRQMLEKCGGSRHKTAFMVYASAVNFFDMCHICIQRNLQTHKNVSDLPQKESYL